MVVGVARALAGTLSAFILGMLLCLCAPAGSPASASDTSAPRPAIANAALPGAAPGFTYSTNCTVPDATVATRAALPSLAAAIRERRAVRVLAVGAAPGVGHLAAGRPYWEQIEEILERAVSGLDIEFVNRGVSGESAAETSVRLRNEVALVNPDIVLWQVGSNDATRRVPAAEFEETVSDTVRWMKQQRRDIVLVGLHYTRGLASNEHYRAIKEALGRVAASNDVLLVRRYEAMQFIASAGRDQERIARNEFQFSELCARCMAEHVARAMTISAFMRRPSEGLTTEVPTPAPTQAR